MQLQRETTAERINLVVNDPEVRCWIAPDDRELDLSGIVADERNIVLMHESGLGGVVFIQLEPGVYELHTQFRPGAQSFARRFVSLALEELFIRSDAMELFTRVPKVNKVAWRFTQSFDPALQGCVPAIGPGGEPGETLIFRMTLWDWVLTSDAKPSLERVAESLELPPDPFIGATLKMIFSPQLAKGLTLYARYARVSGFPLPVVLSLEPPRIMLNNLVLEELPKCQ